MSKIEQLLGTGKMLKQDGGVYLSHHDLVKIERRLSVGAPIAGSSGRLLGLNQIIAETQKLEAQTKSMAAQIAIIRQREARAKVIVEDLKAQVERNGARIKQLDFEKEASRYGDYSQN